MGQLSKHTQLLLSLSSFLASLQILGVWLTILNAGTRKTLVLILVHSFDEKTRNIFHMLILYTSSKLSSFACLRKQYLKNYIIDSGVIYFYVSLNVFLSVAETNLKLVVSSEPQW